MEPNNNSVPKSISAHCLQLNGWYDSVIAEAEGARKRIEELENIIKERDNRIEQLEQEIKNIEGTLKIEPEK